MRRSMVITCLEKTGTMKKINFTFLSSLKINHLILIFCLFTYGSFLITGCNSTESQVLPGSDTTETPASAPKNNSTSALNQNGDYSQLFNPGLKNCEFLTVSEFADAISVEENQVATKDNGYYCEYTFKDDKGLLTRFQITNNPMKKTAIEKEIKGSLDDAKSFGKDSRLVEVRESVTGDTYLIMNQDRHVKLLNNNYENFTNVAYTPVFDAKEKDVEFIKTKRAEMRNKAFAIANALLKKYKK